MIACRRFCFLLGVAMNLAPGLAGQALTPAEERAAYAGIGSAFANNMRIPELNWTEAQLDAFIVGLRAAQARKSIPLDANGQRLLQEIQRRMSAPPPAAAPTATATEPDLARYLRMARQQFFLQQSDSGLLYRMLRSGVGVRPGMEDTVVLTFTATGPDAKTEIPALSGRAVRVKVSELVPGLAEGVQRLALGGQALFVVPPQLSYGSGAWPEGVERGSPIIFQVDLIDVAAADAKADHLRAP